MAKMIPLELKDGEYISIAEKEVFDILKNGLSDDWVVIYSLRWSTDESVFIGKSQGECDYILVNQDYGIMILEVKGGTINCYNGEWFSISYNNVQIPIKDPDKQVNEAKYSLMSRLKKAKVNPYITTAVCFPDCIAEKCCLPLSMPKEVVLDMTSLDCIEERIVEIFKYKADKEKFKIDRLIDSDYRKVLEILNPKVEIKIPLLRLTNNLNMRYMKLNEEQNLFFEQLDENKIISVKGHAGTGKTVLAVKKAFRESESNKRVLFLCYNKLLTEKIKEESEGVFQVFAIHDYAEEYLRLYNKEAYNTFQENGDFDEMMSNFLEEVKNNKSKHKMFFDSIIIDEGQDFLEEWFNAINELLSEDASLCVFYDENQMLYKSYGRNDISFLDKGTKYTLMRNMRNTDEICKGSLNVIKANKNSIRLNGVNGIKPDIIFSEDSFDTLSHLKNVIIKLKKNEYLKDENITVLTMEAKNKIKLKKNVLDVFKGTVESIRKFKGLESDVVIIPDLKHDFMENEEVRNLLYVGMSRAKAHVVLIIDTGDFNRKQRTSYKNEIRELILN